jgi:hypothetical protein
MKHLSISARFGIFGLLAAVSLAALLPANGVAQLGWDQGASYVITIKDSAGNFASRGVITLHADHTMSVIDSNQGGPAYFFSSQLGSWQAGRNGKLVAKTIDFDYPPGQDVARLDYSFEYTHYGNQVQGTVVVTTFPLENGNPLGDGGTVLGTFTFVGQLVKP